MSPPDKSLQLTFAQRKYAKRGHPTEALRPAWGRAEVPAAGGVLEGEQRPKRLWHFAVLGAPGQGCPGSGPFGQKGRATDGGQSVLEGRGLTAAVTRCGLPDRI